MPDQLYAQGAVGALRTGPAGFRPAPPCPSPGRFAASQTRASLHKQPYSLLRFRAFQLHCCAW
ncbi:hypothetical protein CHLRE_10g456226v5 [Chlamydomonas reinhardtii]|uniref:Uncharacterized protein n=1 Tax=Chlamydomonas reinhardtii TaxID=3055 RepID=A0A2K3DBI4_CHLRE|nr:uncharacterized protein CHLRE_10g456226v5 [Chlamydomonas reinhardtii]PNW77898.1 hypothetical protein CHLRE_10g456226v5 [Chlamydomonas reinhardtii]